MAAAPPAPIALVIHGHFYQPPRENPWTDQVSREPSAAPAHDWNERILAECYRANAFARVHGAGNLVDTLVNNYAYLSFNVGPTLARWIDRADPTTLARMRAGDEVQRRRLGMGGGMAQVWGHPITPLLSPRDRRTQILWGLQDFENRFGRKSDGIWLPETATDPATMEALIDAGVQYTVIAPEQIAAVRAPGGTWKTVNRDTVDTGRAYRFLHGDGSGRSIALAVFDGPLSRELAFGNATRDSESFLATMKASAERSTVEGRRLVLAASDGELYGHHKKFADLTLAHAASVGAAKAGIEVTNLGAYLRQDPALWEAELAKGPEGEGTAWSCAHGLGRWERHCGCAMRSPDESGWSQAWRTPLRLALDRLRDRATDFYGDAAGDLFADPWEVRDAYGAVMESPVEARARLLVKLGRPALRGRVRSGRERALGLLELQRASLLMYASCGWFFDDVAGVESALVIRQAAYALDLWKRLGGRPPVKEILEILGEARSNLPGAGTGADVFQRVSQHRTTPAHVVAAAAMTDLVGAAAPVGGDLHISGFAVKRPVDRPARAAVVAGKASVEHARTGETESLDYHATAKSLFALSCRVGKQTIALKALPDDAREPIALALVIRLANSGLATPRDCRRALELAQASMGAGNRTDPIFQPALAALIPQLLSQVEAESASADTVSIIGDLLDSMPEGERSELGKRVQEWLWIGLERLRARSRGPTTLLRTLADRVGLAPQGAP